MSKVRTSPSLSLASSKRWYPPVNSWYPLLLRKLRRLLVGKGFIRPRPMPNQPNINFPTGTRRERFIDIYSRNIWNSGQANVPISGPGSTLEVTHSFREYLDSFCVAKYVQSVVDIGCGDLHWMPSTRLFAICRYTGIDINPELINKHSSAYPQHQFLARDVVTESLPSGDLAIIRDITFHMTHVELKSLFRSIKGKFKYYFITSCVNLENVNGFDRYHYHEVNLFLPPFRFTHYLDRIWEPEFQRYIYLFLDDHIII